MDPIQLLRDFFCHQLHVKDKNLQDMTQKMITLEDKMLVFCVKESSHNRPLSTLKLPLQTPTAWRIKNKTTYYTLGSLWSTIEFRDQNLSDYMKESQRIGVPFVNAIERKPIVSYFTGVTDNNDQIDI